MNARLLLDTNVLLWTITPSHRISQAARRAMGSPNTSLVISVVSLWELILKHHAGKLQFEAGLPTVLNSVLYESPWTILSLKPDHLHGLVNLPPLHKDPFDRLLIAQARQEALTIVTSDEQIARYDVATLW